MLNIKFYTLALTGTALTNKVYGPMSIGVLPHVEVVV